MWTVLWAYLLVVLRSQSDNPPPKDVPLALQLAAYVVGGPLAVFACWRLLLWIGNGPSRPAKGSRPGGNRQQQSFDSQARCLLIQCFHGRNFHRMD